MQTDLILGIIPLGACGPGPQGIEAAGVGWNCRGEGFMGSWPPCRRDAGVTLQTFTFYLVMVVTLGGLGGGILYWVYRLVRR